MARTNPRPLEESVEFAENPELRCPCVLLLDTSGSMSGERIDALNRGVRSLQRHLVKDSLASRRIEISIVTFSDRVRTIQDFVTADRFHPPTLVASGRTHMAEGLQRAMDLIERRKDTYRHHGIAYYRPWIVMITDGKPEGETDEAVAAAAERVRVDEEHKRVLVFAVCVSGGDVAAVSRMVTRPPMELDGLRFDSLFLWLSSSMQSVSQSQPDERVTLPRLNWVRPMSDFLRNYGDLIATVTRIGIRIAGVKI